MSSATVRGDESEPLISARGIVKSFGHIQALRGAAVDIYPGEILALVGDNGAGKSTLASVFCGALAPDAGELEYCGEQVTFRSVREASSRGIAVVFQDLALAPDLDAMANLFLGQEILRRGLAGRLGFLDRQAMAAQAQESIDKLGASLPVRNTRVRDLSGGQRQAVAIGRSIHWASRLLIMDEPTAALGALQRALVLDAIRTARSHGLGILLISHDLPTVLDTADRIAVMRHGLVTTTVLPAETDVSHLVRLMVG